MNGNEFLDKMELVDPAFVAAADAPVKRRSFVPYLAAAAACAALVVGIWGLTRQEPVNPVVDPQIQTPTLPLEHRSTATVGLYEPVQPPCTWAVNPMPQGVSVDMDVTFTHLDSGSVEMQGNFQDYFGISYRDFTAKVPDNWTLKDIYTENSPTGDGSYAPRDYILSYAASNGATMELHICPTGEPLRDCFMDNPKLSTVAGTEVALFYSTDGGYATFCLDGVYYDVDVSGVTLEEMKDLLVHLIVPKTAAPAQKAELVYFSEEEMFGMIDLLIFRGRVTSLTNITLDFSGEQEQRCLAEIAVEKTYQGIAAPGETVKMLLPWAIDSPQEDTGIISRLETGMEGIFMPKVYDAESRWEQNGAVLYLQELAPCGLMDGVRWAFLDTPGGLVFAENAYPGAAGCETLDEVESYIGRMLG